MRRAKDPNDRASKDFEILSVQKSEKNEGVLLPRGFGFIGCQHALL